MRSAGFPPIHAFAKSYQTTRVSDEGRHMKLRRALDAIAVLEGVWIPSVSFIGLNCPSFALIVTYIRIADFLFPTRSPEIYMDGWVYCVPLARQPRQ